MENIDDKHSPYEGASAPMGGSSNTDYIPVAPATVVVEPELVHAIPAANPPVIGIATPAVNPPVVGTATPVMSTINTSTNQIPIREDMGREPVLITCPHCGQTGMTKVRDKCDSGTLLWGFLCCVFGFWPCALLPLCSDKFGTTEHKCRYCGTLVGKQESFSS